jgi:hypothetical protein
MRKLARRTCRPPGSETQPLLPIFRGAWLLAGIPLLVLFAVIIATGRDSTLVHFLYWLTAVWIVLVRYVEAGAASGESMMPNRPATRQWARFSAILGAAAVSLYVLVTSLVAWRPL